MRDEANRSKDETRRHELIDRKFLKGLTPEEQDELAALNSLADEDCEDFYKPIIEALKEAG